MEITKAVRIWTLSIVVISMITTVFHQWHTQLQLRNAKFLQEKYDQEHETLDANALPLATHRHQRSLESINDFLALEKEETRYYIGIDGDGYGNGHSSGGKPVTVSPSLNPATDAPVQVVLATTEPSLLTTVGPQTTPIKPATLDYEFTNHPAPSPDPLLMHASLPDSEPTAMPEVPSEFTSGPVLAPVPVFQVARAVGRVMPPKLETVTPSSPASTALDRSTTAPATGTTTEATNALGKVPLREDVACIELSQVPLEVWFTADTDPNCLSNACSGESQCCRYHPESFLKCDDANSFTSYPCLCTEFTTNPRLLPISVIQEQLSTVTFLPTMEWTESPTGMMVGNDITSNPTGEIVLEPAPSTYAPTNEESIAFSDHSEAALTGAPTLQPIAFEIIEPEFCLPFDQAAPLIAHPRTDLACVTNECDHGCCRIRTWLTCDKSNAYADSPCVCNAHTANAEAIESQWVVPPSMELTSSPTEGPVAVSTSPLDEEEIDSVCAAGSVFQTIPYFAHFTPCFTSKDCVNEAGHCCLKKYCLCGPANADAATDCIPPIPLPDSELPSFTVVPTFEDSDLPSFTLAPTDGASDRQDEVAEDVIVTTADPTFISTLSPTEAESLISTTEPVQPLLEYEPCLAFNENLSKILTHPNAHPTCQSNSCGRGCCRAYQWLVCDENNDFAFIPCVCNENTQDPFNFVPSSGPEKVEVFKPHEECKNGSPFHTQEGYSQYKKCFDAQGCGDEECCLSRYCFCGKNNGQGGCVPQAPESDIDNESDLVTLESPDEVDMETLIDGSDTQATEGVEAPTGSHKPIVIASASPSIASPVDDGVFLQETVACVPFDEILLSQSNHTKTNETCKTNTCPGGCCRSALWLVCDEVNGFSSAPCVCNENTRDPASFPAQIEPDPDDSTAPEEICHQGSFYQTLPSFSGMTPCYASTDCGTSEQCCLKQYCLCGVPSDALTECVPPLPAKYTTSPTGSPSPGPSRKPTMAPTTTPGPTAKPSQAPSADPTAKPTTTPTTVLPTTVVPTTLPPTSPPTDTPLPLVPIGPADECVDGSEYHGVATFSSLTPCFKAEDCGADGCCMKKFCFCGTSENKEDECVPFPPLEDIITESLRIATEAPTNNTTNEESWLETNFTEYPTIEVTNDQSGLEVTATSPPRNSVHLIELAACVPFDSNILDNSVHPSSDETCQTNTCPRGCCRSYWWLLCDENNEYTFAPCVCNENTQDPTNFVSNTPVVTEVVQSEEGTNAAVCSDGSPYQRLPSFRHLSPCYGSHGCDKGECCVAKFCLCMNPRSVDECVTPLPENVVLDIQERV